MSRGLLVTLVLTVGCGFQGNGDSPGTPVAIDAAVPATVDAPPARVTCGDLSCDPRSTCDPETVTCHCNLGFEGDGLSCHDIDECTVTPDICTGIGQATCQNTPGSHECFTLKSCAEAKAHGMQDGEVTVYAGGDPSKPWMAYCKGESEYLTLRIGADKNFAQYTHETLGSDVRTTYQRVRIDPVTFVVDIEDVTFATSTGQLLHGGTIVKTIAYGVAMDCSDNNSADGVANIDLRGLPFKVISSYQLRGTNGGSNPTGTAVGSSGNQVVDITGGGRCGWAAPAPAPNNPFNTFTDNSKILKLEYVPPS